jgi:hypothetical protein
LPKAFNGMYYLWVYYGKLFSRLINTFPLDSFITSSSVGMVWYGMVWYGMVWYGMVWYGMVWYGMVWYGMVWWVLRVRCANRHIAQGLLLFCG